VRALHFPAPLDTLSLTVSVGATLCDADSDWAGWYSLADAALYRAKGDGSNTWQIHHD
jgi:diguanylate cyclase